MTLHGIENTYLETFTRKSWEKDWDVFEGMDIEELEQILTDLKNAYDAM